MSDLVAAVKANDRRGMLEGLRDVIVRRIADGVRGRDLAALSLQLLKVLKELDEEPITRTKRPRGARGRP
jgi:hypothetical protein